MDEKNGIMRKHVNQRIWKRISEWEKVRNSSKEYKETISLWHCVDKVKFYIYCIMFDSI